VPRHVFVVGTDTGVGKTRVAQALVAAAVRSGHRAIGMKPVASGCRSTPAGLRSEDAEILMQTANVQAAYADVNPYAFAPPVSPHIAAREAGVDVSVEVVQRHFARLAEQADCVIVEGAGGWLAPIGERLTMADIALGLRLPLVLVVGMRLGCLNHAALTQQAIARSGLALAGWVANCLDADMDRLQENLDVLARELPAPCWTVLPHSPRGVTASVIEQLRNTVIPE
jgi:dethiobiotin synthetase